jgi:hypothetical protein
VSNICFCFKLHNTHSQITKSFIHTYHKHWRRRFYIVLFHKQHHFLLLSPLSVAFDDSPVLSGETGGNLSQFLSLRRRVLSAAPLFYLSDSLCWNGGEHFEPRAHCDMENKLFLRETHSLGRCEMRVQLALFSYHFCFCTQVFICGVILPSSTRIFRSGSSRLLDGDFDAKQSFRLTAPLTDVFLGI